MRRRKSYKVISKELHADLKAAKEAIQRDGETPR